MADELLTDEEVLECEVGIALSEANLAFQSKDWIKMSLAVAKLWLIFYFRIREELVLAAVKNYSVPEDQRN